MKDWKFKLSLLLILSVFVIISVLGYILISYIIDFNSYLSVFFYTLILSLILSFSFSLSLILYLRKSVLSRLQNHKQLTSMITSSAEQTAKPSQPIENNETKPKISTPAKIDKLPREEAVKINYYDELTSLPNRVYFNEILHKTISHAKRHNSQLAIVLIDIDHFEKINKTYNKNFGDLVLKAFGQRLKEILRDDDVLARSGGDEFIILLNDIDHPKFASPVAEKIMQACAHGLEVNGKKIILKSSIGIALYPNDGQSLEDLEKKADAALFKAKRLGGGVCQYFQQEMEVAVHEHIEMEHALKNAIDNNELILFFQPELSLENGTIKTVEALLRWEHPRLGLLSPEKFIPFAEQTGLIIPLGEWALREACRINKGWQDAGYEPVTVSVNISPLQFHDQDLHKLISNILKETNLPARCLEIEITETTVMDNMEVAVNKLTALHDMGVSIALDDFGTGYTSINYLRQFPVNVLKIDQTFIKGIPHNQNDLAITSAVISLGHNLGLDVVAEGVETIEQIQYLAENNCDLIQGYFLSRPLPAAKIVLQFSRKGGIRKSLIKS